MAAPWLGNMPGWRETGFWQYENEELDRIGQQLFRGEFKSREERDELYRQMTAMALDETVRVWLVTGVVAFPLRPELQDVNEDIVSGPATTLTLREARVEGRDEIKVGHLWVWTERTTFNPVGGLGDVYSINIWRNMTDPPILNHPHTSMPIPFRAQFAVETAGPTGTLPVPEDAVVWDAAGSVWKPVGPGVTAVSKVTYDYSKYFQSTWHHGPVIDPADLVISIAQSFDLAYDEQKIQIETALGITQRPYLETFRGFRLLPDNRIEVYVNNWHFEPSYIASYATPSGVSTPWELLAAMDTLVFEKRTAAYSDTAAARFSVPWLSLVQESDARLVVRQLREFGRTNAVPAGVFDVAGRSLVTPEQAAARYEAAIAWFEQTNLLMISNGPFFLARYDPSAQYAEMHAFRQENYPFKPGDFALARRRGCRSKRLRHRPPCSVNRSRSR
jgi:peptide/nickel transport system substrate-binding protein